jgi:hypothetical protein
MTAPLTTEQREELRELLRVSPRVLSAAGMRRRLTRIGELLPALLDAADRAEELEARVKVLEGLLGEATTATSATAPWQSAGRRSSLLRTRSRPRPGRGSDAKDSDQGRQDAAPAGCSW